MSVISEHETQTRRLADAGDYEGAIQEKKKADRLRSSLPVTGTKSADEPVHVARSGTAAVSPPVPASATSSGDTLGPALAQLSLSTPPRRLVAPANTATTAAVVPVAPVPGPGISVCRRSNSLSSSPVDFCPCPACDEVDLRDVRDLVVSQSEVVALLGTPAAAAAAGGGGGGGCGGSGELLLPRTGSGVRPLTLLPPPPMLPAHHTADGTAQSGVGLRKRGTTAFSLLPDMAMGFQGDGSSDTPVLVPPPVHDVHGTRARSATRGRGRGRDRGRGGALLSSGFTTASEISDDVPVKPSAAKRVRRTPQATAAAAAAVTTSGAPKQQRASQVQDEDVQEDQE